MRPVSFDEQTTVIGKPESMTDQECESLPAFMGHDSLGFPVIISKWELSPAEMTKIQETGAVFLVVVGKATPPVSLHIDSPFNNPQKEE